MANRQCPYIIYYVSLNTFEYSLLNNYFTFLSLVKCIVCLTGYFIKQTFCLEITLIWGSRSNFINYFEDCKKYLYKLQLKGVSLWIIKYMYIIICSIKTILLKCTKKDILSISVNHGCISKQWDIQPTTTTFSLSCNTNFVSNILEFLANFLK